MQKSFSFRWFRRAMRDEVFVNNWNYSTFDGSLWGNGIGFWCNSHWDSSSWIWDFNKELVVNF